MMKKFLPIVALLIAGCTASPSATYVIPEANLVIKSEFPNVISWSKDINVDAQLAWCKEASKRFKDPILFGCHGGYEFVERQIGDQNVTMLEWWVYPDPPRKPMSAQAAADTLANLYPNRDIVFTSCNANGFDLKTKRVFYAKQKVWIIPDDFQPTVGWRHETQRNFDTVGSIWEFVTYDGHSEIPTGRFVCSTTRPSTQPASRPTK